MKEKIYEMLQLQNELNNDTNGVEWRKGITKNKKVINWKRCIYMETAELIDSFPWKHWKSIDKKPDFENIKIELVDIWHFLMSYLLVYNPIEKAALIIENSVNTPVEVKIPQKWTEDDNLKIDFYLDIFEELMALSLIQDNSDFYQEMLCQQFFKCCSSTTLSFNELYKLYIGKNALNYFRQKHGYKEGTYKKIWSGKEDNVVMQEILTQNPDITFSLLLDRLESIYLDL